MVKKILAALAALGAGLSAFLFVLLRKSEDKRKVEEAEDRAANAERIADAEKAAREAENKVAKKAAEIKREDEKLDQQLHSGDNINSFNAGISMLRKQAERGSKRNSSTGSNGA